LGAFCSVFMTCIYTMYIKIIQQTLGIYLPPIIFQIRSRDR
jgi:hypothetical protein